MKTIRFLLAASLLFVIVAVPASARTLIVHPGGSIRVALASALPGDRIEVLPGIYKEGAAGDLNALAITIDRIELLGRSTPGKPVVLENAGGQSFGVWVSPANSAGPGPEADDEHPPCGFDGSRIHGFSIRGFTLRGFQKHGLHLACVDGFHTVTLNKIENNGFTGIAVASLCLGLALQGAPCTGLDVDPDASGNRIILNELENNGTIPQADPFFDSLRADLIWDGSGTGNCWSENRFATTTPPLLPSCH